MGDSIEKVYKNKITNIFHETDVISKKDYEEGFKNYAQTNATVDFTSRVRNIGEDRLANVVGVVKDYDTDTMLADADIVIGGEILVSTGLDGRFQIKNFPSGIYDWEIDVEDYCSATYSNYEVDCADGTTIFTFYVSDKFAINRDREDILKAESQKLSSDHTSRENVPVSSVSRSLTYYPDTTNDIYIYYDGNMRSLGREEYIYTVVASELYGVTYYINKGLSESQVEELYLAQAIASNTFLEYAIKCYSPHSSVGCYVCNNTCCQKYDPTKVTQKAIDVTTNIFYTIGNGERTNILMYDDSTSVSPETCEYIYGAFCSSCYNQGTLNHPTQPALRAVSCTDIATGYGGNRYGMCQMGAALCAKNGDTGFEILHHYYTDCHIVSCPLE